MDIIVICNGLGNQMSQYAFYLEKKSRNKNTRFIFDKKSWKDHNGYELGRVFGIEYKETFLNSTLYFIFRILGIEKWPSVSKRLIKIINFFGISLIKEPSNYDYTPDFMRSKKGLRFFYGGWHSEKYFIESRDEVLRAFMFKQETTGEVLRSIEKIRNTNSVSIHVRRGDYLSQTNIATFGSVCSREYFLKAIEKIYTLVDDPHFFVFSNDVVWVKENLNIDNLTIIDYNKGLDSWKDMMLMSYCKHNINSNSSFSWWAAWLNSNHNKTVVVPKFFINNLITKDIYPENWLSLSNY